MEKFLRILKHLLPRGRAFKITTDKPLRDFMIAVAEFFDLIRAHFDNIYDDTLPAYTRRLDDYEEQFALPPSITDDSLRRQRLDAAWKATGGQSARYIQDTLRGAGFDVYVHECFPPGDTGAIRDPNGILRGGSTSITWQARSGAIRSGSTEARSGNFQGVQGFAVSNIIGGATTPPPIPSDPTLWPYFMYVGAETFPGIANVAPARRDEFLALCMKICPCHLWLGVLVEFS